MLASVCASAAAPPSSINLTVETTAADLATIINQSLPKELYKGQGGLGTSVSVVRTGPMVVNAADNYLYLTLPVQLTFKYVMYESYPLKAGLKFKVKVNVTPDWRLKTEFYYMGLSDNLADDFKVGPLSLKPKSMVDNISQPVQKLLAPVIDAKVNDAVQLKPKVARLWQNAFSPTLVSKEFSAWLKLAPERIVMSPLSAANNQVRLSIGIVTGAEIVVGPKPTPAPVKALPQVQQLQAFDKAFRIQLGTDIFYADLVEALKPVLLEKTFGEDKKITVKGFNLKGEDGRLIVILNATGDFNGELTLLAKPVYNPQNNSLTFEDVDFDTKGAGVLIGAGSWLFSSTIKKTIKTKLDGSVSEQLEKARGKASSALASVQIAEHVRLTGAVKSLGLGEPAVLSDRLSLQVVALGESSVSLK
ncbi:protein of unknown function DUF4403 [Citrifermentans bemidjiense Bem]|uniref:DUF4403 family protein n=1 Tax=Citrifermentans bemidjiense (strain ATCC BAA-1014 / DSM 16622 / JCM 12645 / Bem) TaxID=404380 RepID=B5EHK5_CITBB|nr:DUF4403 family protein [Citrifermentans bemidjiense]ACH38215.1 protein of unknown function DUF4403 [Citrifermentans bemidjiense Bem]